MKVLVMGWFSFHNAHATAGDVLARDVVCRWLTEGNYSFDVAVDPPFTDGIDWRSTRPEDYTHIVFVCGPWQRGKLEDRLLQHFAGRRFIGVDLSMLLPLDEWNPFDALFERDSSANARPDIVFLSRKP